MVASKKIVVITAIVAVLFAGCLLAVYVTYSSWVKEAEIASERFPVWGDIEKLCSLSTLEKLADNAKVKGKIAYVSRDLISQPSLCYLEGYKDWSSGFRLADTGHFAEEMYAIKPDEIDTLIKVELKRGNFLKTFTTETGKQVKIYTRLIEISIIDYRSLTMIAKQEFEDKRFPDDANSVILPAQRVTTVEEKNGSKSLQYVLDAPLTAEFMKPYLSKFSDKVKPFK